MSKALFVLRSTAHYPYVSSIISNLDCKVIYDKQWSNHEADWMVTRTSNRWIFLLRELRTYISYLKRDQSKYYLKRWGRLLPLWARLLAHHMQGVLFWLITAIEKRLPPDKGVVADILDINPDVVVVSPANHRFSNEIEYVKAAKSLGVPTVIVTLSWDNLTTKGLFHVIPDKLLVWNEAQKLEAIRIHGVPKESIVVTGAPFFDKWLEWKPEDRESFCKRMGLDPDRKFFLYLGSSRKIAEDESWAAKRVAAIADNAQMLIRPHPANKNPFKGMDFIMEGCLPDTAEERRGFHSALVHCEFVVGVNTSGMIDAIIHDKPTFAYTTSMYDATQSDATHFKLMLPACGDKPRARREFIDKFIWPRGGPAGLVAARAIMEGI